MKALKKILIISIFLSINSLGFGQWNSDENANNYKLINLKSAKFQTTGKNYSIDWGYDRNIAIHRYWESPYYRDMFHFQTSSGTPFVFEGESIELLGSTRNFTFSNFSETESGIYFEDAQASNQYSHVLYDAQNENLNFYVHGTLSTTSDVLMQMTPLRKVLVNGTFVAKEIFVQTNVWADYVFKKDYQLMPLYELENYIQKNNHLPNIPSEEEILDGGINVSEMNVMLMEKVEELTLYVIQLKKEIDELKNK